MRTCDKCKYIVLLFLPLRKLSLAVTWCFLIYTYTRALIADDISTKTCFVAGLVAVPSQRALDRIRSGYGIIDVASFSYAAFIHYLIFHCPIFPFELTKICRDAGTVWQCRKTPGLTPTVLRRRDRCLDSSARRELAHCVDR